MKVLDAEQGYDLYAPQYKRDYKHLDDFDWNESRELLFRCINETCAGMAAAVEARDVTAASNSKHVAPKLLDLGCGDGRVLKRLERAVATGKLPASLELNGWDISTEMVRFARKHCQPSTKLLRRDLFDPSAPPDQFDIVCAFFVIVHAAEPERFFQAVKRILRPGGTLVCNNIPQKSAPVFRDGGMQFQIQFHHHDVETIEHAAENVGFALVEKASTQDSTLFSFVAPAS